MPIIVGYIVAHYLTYLVEYGQQTLIQVSDPLQQREQLVRHRGLAGELLVHLPPDAAGQRSRCSRSSWATSSVSIAAHERAVRLLPKKHQLTGQLPLLVAMIAFTVGGLLLLFSA